MTHPEEDETTRELRRSVVLLVVGLVGLAIALVSLFVIPGGTVWTGWVGGTGLGICITVLVVNAAERRLGPDRYR